MARIRELRKSLWKPENALRRATEPTSRTVRFSMLVEAKRRPGPRPRAEGHQRGAGDDWVCVDLDRVVVQLLSEEARERLGLEDLHTGAWDPQLDEIEDVPWRNYVEGEPLPPDR